MINIVIPAAGLGSRFAKEGFKKAKPFIDVLGKAMIVRVLENLACDDARFIIILRKEHLESEKILCEQIKKDFNVLFIGIDKLTEGTACTVLFAREFINNDTPLIIANSDQIVDLNLKDFIEDCKIRKLDGSLLCFIDSKKDNKWSFVKIEHNLVVEVREKQVISKFATVGIYLFSKGKFFVDNALQMILENDRINNEFYTAPVYNYAIKKGLKFGIYNIEEEKMHGIGTPQDLKKYLEFKKNAKD
ncbi:glycosyltransferase, family 2 [Campylobacter cuniculorum DSM 23162 = LMG 24588]|uniref:Glycosyltransferase, family 2 n=1 Tax=Campylobacter cuniculorum DSM 23162 = LMG 24588 TaxID=1121267 RepID=A0A1W6BWA6_9BACT|nr:glycosyltransferase, family 2 [Campylobacter cuniculorum DSM 23162 = LMG 24588]